MTVQKLAHLLIIIAITVYFLVVAKVFLVPIILAVVLWYIINAVNTLLISFPRIGSKIPNWAGLVLSSLIVLGLLYSVGSLITQNINNMVISSPDYRVNLEQQVSRIVAFFGFSDSIKLETISAELNLGEYLRSLLNSFSTIAQRFLLVLLYTLFLLIEQNTFTRKMAALRIRRERKEKIFQMLTSINISVRKYLGVKFAASLATGFLSYLVISFTGLDYALFWAFLIFVFNFIPTIGSIVATLFPSVVALIQFEYLSPFFIILIGVGIIQIIIGGIIEPRLYGNSLNISPFVVVISLIMWGILWGIPGMLLCIPITVIMITVFAQFNTTRPVAVLLSRNGRV